MPDPESSRGSSADPEADPEVDLDAVVIGAGLGGLTAGLMLRRAGFTRFRIIEKNAGVGGTWWENRYPGAEVDVHSHLYSWSFKRFDWSRSHARQPEIQRYIEEVVDEQGLREHLELGTSVDEAVWEEDRQRYRVVLSTGAILHARAVISAVGLLNTPRYPSWPGFERFTGPKLHTARWEDGLDLTGKHVAVVGVGSSATQVVAALAPVVGRLTVYQREPGWVLPKGDHDYSDADRARHRSESELARRRTRISYLVQVSRAQFRGRMYKPRTRWSQRSRQLAEGYIAAVFADRPDLIEAVTPRYGFAGKRLVLNGDFYPALLRKNVELVPHAVTALTGTGVVDARGVETAVDAIVLATGFRTERLLATTKIIGRSGRTLGETWGDEPRALMGITVPDFPNFFMLYGPSTHGGEIFLNHRAQARWAVRALTRMRRSGVTAVEARPAALRWYVRWLERQIRGTAWLETDSYVKNAAGTVITQWPLDALTYAAMARVLGWIGHRSSRRLVATPAAQDLERAG
ncbi:flavin-containing monooxygenase [Pseudonocardia sp. GCM10023141]|uniref:flavin-containing monooxygenase n=1 Tax=Pseudonocardia sp. GCM10023141 TaxID=3252653 RepID=UPI0036073A63